MKFEVVSTHFGGAVKVIKQKVFGDGRGFFMEAYNREEFKRIGIDIEFVQDNLSYSATAGTLRGIHYQLPPKAQTKLVRCIKGVIYDVVVDLRPNSLTFKQWEAFVLSEHNKLQLLVPKGFGHAFLTLTDNVLIYYKVDEYYSPEHDRSLAWNDPDINVEWPYFDEYVLSEKDKSANVLVDHMEELELFRG